MKPIDALKTATWLGANSLGLGKDVGSLEAGKMADMVILDKNPLVDLHNSIANKTTIFEERPVVRRQHIDEVWPRVKKNSPFPWNGGERFAHPGQDDLALS